MLRLTAWSLSALLDVEKFKIGKKATNWTVFFLSIVLSFFNSSVRL